MKLANFAVGAPADLSVDWNSEVVNTASTLLYSIQLVYTGTPLGTFSLESSNGNDAWTEIENSGIAVNADGNIMYNIQNCGYSLVRVKWVASLGSVGELTTAQANTKGY